MIKKLSKKASLLSALVLTMALFAGCSNEKENQKVADIEVKTIATKELQDKLSDDSWVVVDTRINDAFNGWKLDEVERGGHITLCFYLFLYL